MTQQEYNPMISVATSPPKVARGQMMSITANIVDRYTMEPMNFDHIFMEIIDEKGIPVWPLSLVEEESAFFSKLISTSEMEPGRYLVRVTPSRSLRPIGTAFFEVTRDLIPPALLIPGELLIPSSLLVSGIESKQREKVDSDIVLPESPILKIAWLVYRTERDSRVCKYCRPHEGKRFRPTDPDLVVIPVHPRCRCHFDIISIEEEQEIYQAMRYYQALGNFLNYQQMEMLENSMIVNMVRKKKAMVPLESRILPKKIVVEE